jgi:hypothetical protein
MNKIRIIIGEKWSMMEEVNDKEFPLFVEIENGDLTESEIIDELMSEFFDGEDWSKPDYTANDCVFIRDKEA